MILPKEDRSYVTKTQMQEQIIHLLGGRCAEKLILDDISTGASNDIMRATEIARDMITKYGFSDRLGTINYSTSNEEVFLGRDFNTHKNYSEEVASIIDEEIKSIIDSAYKTAFALLKKNKAKLNKVARALLEIETLDGEQFEKLYTGKQTVKGLITQTKKAEEVTRKKNAKEAKETQAAAKKAKEEAQKQLEAENESKLSVLTDVGHTPFFVVEEEPEPVKQPKEKVPVKPKAKTTARKKPTNTKTSSVAKKTAVSKSPAKPKEKSSTKTTARKKDNKEKS
jgi:cell division protease FtsH